MWFLKFNLAFLKLSLAFLKLSLAFLKFNLAFAALPFDMLSVSSTTSNAHF